MKKLFLLISLFSLSLISLSSSELDFLLKDDNEIYNELMISEIEKSEESAKVEQLKGEAYVQRDGNSKWLQLIKNDPIKDKDTIITMEGSELSIKLIDETLLKIGEKTKLNFNTSEKTSEIEKLSETGFDLAMGKIYSNIRNKMEKGGKYFVDSGSIVAGVRGKKDANADEEIENKELKTTKNKILEDRQNYKFYFETGIVYTDNAESSSNKKSDTYFDTKLKLSNKLEYNNRVELMSSVAFENENYFELSKNNKNELEIEIEALRKMTRWSISTPLSYNLKYLDNEINNTNIGIGVKGKREVRDLIKNSFKIDKREKVYLSIGTDIILENNKELNYDGFSNLVYSEIKTNFSKIEITTGLELELTNYDLDSESYFASTVYLTGEKLINSKYLLSGSYEFIQKNYQKSGIENNHIISTEMESNIFETNWKYLLSYNLEINDFDSEKYNINKLSFKLKREFN